MNNTHILPTYINDNGNLLLYLNNNMSLYNNKSIKTQHLFEYSTTPQLIIHDNKYHKLKLVYITKILHKNNLLVPLSNYYLIKDNINKYEIHNTYVVADNKLNYQDT